MPYSFTNGAFDYSSMTYAGTLTGLVNNPVVGTTATDTPVNIGDVNGDGNDDFATLSRVDVPTIVMMPVYGFDPIMGMLTVTYQPMITGYTYNYTLTVRLAGDSSAMDGVSGFQITLNGANWYIDSFGSCDVDDDGYRDVYLTYDTVPRLVYGHTTNDVVGDTGDNVLTGANGNDSLSGDDGNDILRGGLRYDTLDGGAGNDTLNGGAGTDTMIGGAGDDLYIVSDSGDVVLENADEGTDRVLSAASSYTLSDNVENLTIAAVAGAADGTGNALANEIHGNAAANTLDGADGDDSLFGFGGKDSLIGGGGADVLSGGAGHDSLDGGTGDDTLYGGLGVDRLTGGMGADTFMFTSSDLVSGRTFDIINDFSQSDGDVIDFSAFDADLTTSGQQGFTFIGTEYFSGHAGELRYVYDAVNDYTYVRGDLDGDGRADLSIRLDGQVNLVASDFDLLFPS